MGNPDDDHFEAMGQHMFGSGEPDQVGPSADEWRHFCLAMFMSKGWSVATTMTDDGPVWTISEPHPDGSFDEYELGPAHEWNQPRFIKLVGLVVTGEDLLTPALDQLKTEIIKRSERTEP